LLCPLSKEHSPTLNSTFVTPIHAILDFLAPARPDPLRTDELVSELRPVPLPRMQH
jgi:hypothetical protein